MAETGTQQQEHKRPPNFCTHCNDEEPWDDPRAFGLHLERHREVKPEVKDPRTGKTLSTPCPEKCGRHFIRPSEYREHVPLCDGSPPLWKPSPGTPAPVTEHETPRPIKEQPMVKCPDCDEKFKDGRGLAPHRRKEHGAKASARAGASSKRKSPEPSTGSASYPIREKAKQLRIRAGELDELADRVDALLAD